MSPPRIPLLSVCLAGPHPTFSLGLQCPVLTVTASGLSPPRHPPTGLAGGGFVPALTHVPLEDPDKAQQQLRNGNRNFIKTYGLYKPSGTHMVGVGGAPLLLQRIRGGSSGAVTAHTGTEQGHTATEGLGERSFGSREWLGHTGWGNLARQQG